ncbi:MAG TPA: hypothetical protein VH087_02420 [Thermoanaerobaculia bacterium]|jgi:hypothetical protein|nr:hypothetical protein [Thermoanaerobaculia bacterium]
MKTMILNNSSPTPNAAAESPQTETPFTPQEVVDQLRAIRARIADVTPLTAAQREAVRGLTRIVTNEILQASITAIASAGLVQQAVGQQPDDVRALYDESNRWNEAEGELRTILNGIAGANLIRRQRLALIIKQAYGVSAQLANDPVHAQLVPQVEEIKRLKRLARGKKKSAQNPQQPSPTPSTTQQTEMKQ